MLEGAGGHLGHRAGEPSVAPLGQHHAVGPEGLRTAQYRPQVVGIGETIHRHQQGRFAEGAAALDQAGQVEGFGGGRLQHDALVDGTTTDLAQPRPGDFFDQHPGSLGFAQQLQEAGAETHFRRTPNAMNGPASLKHRQARMASPDKV